MLFTDVLPRQAKFLLNFISEKRKESGNKTKKSRIIFQTRTS